MFTGVQLGFVAVWAGGYRRSPGPQSPHAAGGSGRGAVCQRRLWPVSLHGARQSTQVTYSADI